MPPSRSPRLGICGRPRHGYIPFGTLGDLGIPFAEARFITIAFCIFGICFLPSIYRRRQCLTAPRRSRVARRGRQRIFEDLRVFLRNHRHFWRFCGHSGADFDFFRFLDNFFIKYYCKRDHYLLQYERKTRYAGTHGFFTNRQDINRLPTAAPIYAHAVCIAFFRCVT